MDATQIAQARARIMSTGRDVSESSDDDIRKMVAERERRFQEEAPTTAAQAATIILDGAKADRWRILVGAETFRWREQDSNPRSLREGVGLSVGKEKRRRGPMSSLEKRCPC